MIKRFILWGVVAIACTSCLLTIISNLTGRHTAKGEYYERAADLQEIGNLVHIYLTEKANLPDLYEILRYTCSELTPSYVMPACLRYPQTFNFTVDEQNKEKFYDYCPYSLLRADRGWWAIVETQKTNNYFLLLANDGTISRLRDEILPRQRLK